MGTPAVAIGDFRRRNDPPRVELLKRKRQDLARRLDILANELPNLERQRDDAATASYNGGGQRAARQYKKLVEQLAEKASEKDRLKHAIIGLDAQLAVELERLETTKRANLLAEQKQITAFRIKNTIADIRRRLDGCPSEKRIGPNGEEILSRPINPESDPLQRQIWEGEIAKLQRELDAGLPSVKLPGDDIVWQR